MIKSEQSAAVQPVFRRTGLKDPKAFAAAMEIYTAAFPCHERHPLPVIEKRVGCGLNHLYAGYLDNRVVFMALLWPLQQTDFILLDYMATHQNYLGKKIASQFLLYLKSILDQQKKHVILEVEDPRYGSNRTERQKRINFYTRNGARTIKGITLMLPALQGQTKTDMLLMIYPDFEQGRIAANLVKRLIIQIFSELYNCTEVYALENSTGLDQQDKLDLV